MTTEVGTSAAESVLIAILEREHRLCRELLEIAEAEREALTAMDVSRLSAMVPEMTAIAGEIETLEARRIEHVTHLLGEQSADPRLEPLLDRFDPPTADRLRAIKRELAPVVDRLQAICAGNLMLARNAVELNERWRRLLGDDSAVYKADGNVAGPAGIRRAWRA